MAYLRSTNFLSHGEGRPEGVDSRKGVTALEEILEGLSLYLVRNLSSPQSIQGLEAMAMAIRCSKSRGSFISRNFFS